MLHHKFSPRPPDSASTSFPSDSPSQGTWVNPTSSRVTTPSRYGPATIEPIRTLRERRPKQEAGQSICNAK